jgi:intracellular multiplication protein IcmT
MPESPVNAYWRDSARSARFFVVDAYAVLPLILFLLHIRWWTLTVALCATIFFGILERVGFSVPVFLRFMKTCIGGTYKFSRPWWRYQ